MCMATKLIIIEIINPIKKIIYFQIIYRQLVDDITN